MNSERPQVSVVGNGRDGQTVVLSGRWRGDYPLPELQPVFRQLGGDKLGFDATRLSAWDSRTLALITRLEENCRERQISIDRSGLPDGLRKLLSLTEAVPERKDAERVPQETGLLASIGETARDEWLELLEFFGFLGQSVQSLGRLFAGTAQFRRRDFWQVVGETGPSALPIVSLIAVLVGIILAFVGAIQLNRFGAEIYVADLVGVGMVREMGCMMTGIIMAGRTGAAFAAQIGTMQVNEEIDAYRTFGISAMDFLVLPRMMALILMMPLLCIFADAVGIAGGALIAVGAMGLNLSEFWTELVGAIDLTDILLGLGKSLLFGIVIAVTGCMQGLHSGRSAAAVGIAATRAVVSGVVMIVVIDGLFAILTSVLGI